MSGKGKENGAKAIKNRVDVINVINDARTQLGVEDKLDSSKSYVVGGGGYPLDKPFTFTGNVDLVHPIKDADGHVTSTYVALETTNAEEYVSLKSLMGISSPRGYKWNVTLQSEYDDEKGNKTSKEVVLEVSKSIEKDEDHLNWDELFHPTKRDLYEEAAYLIEHPEVIKNKSTQYVGIIGRQFKARKESASTSFEHYGVGYERVITAKLFRKLK